MVYRYINIEFSFTMFLVIFFRIVFYDFETRLTSFFFVLFSNFAIGKLDCIYAIGCVLY